MKKLERYRQLNCVKVRKFGFFEAMMILVFGRVF